MKMIYITILLSLFIGCSHLSSPSKEEIERHCQDLNVLYLKVNLISSNIANVTTTRTPEGGYYKRKIAKNCKNGFCEVVNDTRPPIRKYEPNHPDANKKGYVSYPSISLEQENADMGLWKRVFEDVYANSPVSKNFFFNDPRAKKCFDKYPNLKAARDRSEYLGRNLFGQ